MKKESYSRRKRLLFVCVWIMFIGNMLAQERDVSGSVTDDLNQGMLGVNVFIKGTSIGVVTDLHGNYTIAVPSSESVLVFSFIGFTMQEIRVGNKKTIDVQLEEDSKTLDEIIVVGYGTARKGDLAGALTTLRPDANDASKSVSLDNLLSGKVAGLVVNSSSAMTGAASSVQIRGASSLRGDNQPLYVIDNVPQASTGEFSSSAIGDFQINQDPLSSLNPADIEDITILKDASSTAIYGSRGANGVILITTKKGKKGATRINATANYTIAEPSKLLDLMNLTEYAQYRNMRVNNGLYPFYVVEDEIRYVFSDALGKYDPDNPDTYNLIQYRNWQKEIYTSALSQNYSLALSGGNDNTTYYVSANFKDINGTVKQTGLQQGDLRVNINMNISNRVKLNMVMRGSLRQNDMMAGGSTLGGSTTAISRTALDYAPFELPNDDPSYTGETATTIFSWLNDYVDKANDKTFSTGMDLAWNIAKGLRYNLRAGGNLNTNERKRWWGMQLYAGMNNNGQLAVSNLDKNNISVENVLNYNTELGSSATLDVTGAVTYDQYRFLNKNVVGKQFSFLELRENGMHMAGNITYGQPTQSDYQLLSYLTRVNLSVLNKYILYASLRTDGSSKFAYGNRWGYFPSASMAWRMEEEEFMKSLNRLSQLKLRASYGVTGNQSISPYSTFSMYAGGSVHYGDGVGESVNVMAVTNLANEGLTWEKTSSWNVGADFGFFGSRLSGSLDVYVKRTDDLLISKNLPGSAGFTSTYYNQGSLDNRGVEFSLNAQIVDSKNWKWSVSGNIGKNAAKITNLGLDASDFGCLGQQVGYYGNTIGDHFGVANIFLQGRSPGLFIGFETQGIVQPEDVTDEGVAFTKSDGSIGCYSTVNSSTVSVGDVKFVDQDGDGTITTNDRTIIGDPNPALTYGFQTSLSWRKLTLSAAFNGVRDIDRLNTNVRYNGLPSDKSSTLLREVFRNIWTEENPSNIYPSANYSLVNGWVYDLYVEDASYLRCSDITIDYKFPDRWVRRFGIRNASVFGSVKNAFIITDYNGYDPEVNSFAFDGLRPGIDMSSYPTPRQYIFGLNVTF